VAHIDPPINTIVDSCRTSQRSDKAHESVLYGRIRRFVDHTGRTRYRYDIKGGVDKKPHQVNGYADNVNQCKSFTFV